MREGDDRQQDDIDELKLMEKQTTADIAALK